MATDKNQKSRLNDDNKTGAGVLEKLGITSAKDINNVRQLLDPYSSVDRSYNKDYKNHINDKYAKRTDLNPYNQKQWRTQLAENQTDLERFGNMMAQFGIMVGAGVLDAVGGTIGLVENPDIMFNPGRVVQKNFAERWAENFRNYAQKNYAIYSDSDKWYSGANLMNTVASSGNVFGIGIVAFIENLALSALTAASGGAGAGVQTAKNAVTVGRLKKALSGLKQTFGSFGKNTAMGLYQGVRENYINTHLSGIELYEDLLDAKERGEIDLSFEEIENEVSKAMTNRWWTDMGPVMTLSMFQQGMMARSLGKAKGKSSLGSFNKGAKAGRQATLYKGSSDIFADAVSPLTRNMTKGKGFTEWLLEALSEGIEETWQDGVSAYVDYSTKKKVGVDTGYWSASEAIFTDDLFNSFIGGVIGGGMSGGLHRGIGSYIGHRNNKRTAREISDIGASNAKVMTAKVAQRNKLETELDNLSKKYDEVESAEERSELAKQINDKQAEVYKAKLEVERAAVQSDLSALESAARTDFQSGSDVDNNVQILLDQQQEILDKIDEYKQGDEKTKQKILEDLQKNHGLTTVTADNILELEAKTNRTKKVGEIYIENLKEGLNKYDDFTDATIYARMKYADVAYQNDKEALNKRLDELVAEVFKGESDVNLKQKKLYILRRQLGLYIDQYEKDENQDWTEVISILKEEVSKLDQEVSELEETNELSALPDDFDKAIGTKASLLTKLMGEMNSYAGNVITSYANTNKLAQWDNFDYRRENSYNDVVKSINQISNEIAKHEKDSNSFGAIAFFLESQLDSIEETVNSNIEWIDQMMSALDVGSDEHTKLQKLKEKFKGHYGVIEKHRNTIKSRVDVIAKNEANTQFVNEVLKSHGRLSTDNIQEVKTVGDTKLVKIKYTDSNGVSTTGYFTLEDRESALKKFGAEGLSKIANDTTREKFLIPYKDVSTSDIDKVNELAKKLNGAEVESKPASDDGTLMNDTTEDVIVNDNVINTIGTQAEHFRFDGNKLESEVKFKIANDDATSEGENSLTFDFEDNGSKFAAKVTYDAEQLSDGKFKKTIKDISLVNTNTDDEIVSKNEDILEENITEGIILNAKIVQDSVDTIDADATTNKEERASNIDSDVIYVEEDDLYDFYQPDENPYVSEAFNQLVNSFKYIIDNGLSKTFEGIIDKLLNSQDEELIKSQYKIYVEAYKTAFPEESKNINFEAIYNARFRDPFADIVALATEIQQLSETEEDVVPADEKEVSTDKVDKKDRNSNGVTKTEVNRSDVFNDDGVNTKTDSVELTGFYQSLDYDVIPGPDGRDIYVADANTELRPSGRMLSSDELDDGTSLYLVKPDNSHEITINVYREEDGKLYKYNGTVDSLIAEGVITEDERYLYEPLAAILGDTELKSEEQIVFFVHNPSYYNVQNVGKELQKNLTNAQDKVITLRDRVNKESKNGKYIKVKIEKSGGHFVPLNTPVSIEQAAPKTKLVYALDSTQLGTNPHSVLDVQNESQIYPGFQELHPGLPYLLVESPHAGMKVPIPIIKSKIGESNNLAEMLMTVVEARMQYLRDNKRIENIVQKFGDNITNEEIEEIVGENFSDFLGKYVYVYSDQRTVNEKINRGFVGTLIYKQSPKESGNKGTSFYIVRSYNKDGKIVKESAKLYDTNFNGQSEITATRNEVIRLLEEVDLNFSAIYNQDSHYEMSNGKIVKSKLSYLDHVKSQYKVNKAIFNVGTEDNPKYVAVIHPRVTYEPIDNVASKGESQIISKIKVIYPVVHKTNAEIDNFNDILEKAKEEIKEELEEKKKEELDKTDTDKVDKDKTDTDKTNTDNIEDEEVTDTTDKNTEDEEEVVVTTTSESSEQQSKQDAILERVRNFRKKHKYDFLEAQEVPRDASDDFLQPGIEINDSNTQLDNGIKLTNQQEEAKDQILKFLTTPITDWSNIYSNSNTFSLIGYAGSGKTTLIQAILQEYQKIIDLSSAMPPEIILSAPTHRAKNVIQQSNPSSVVQTIQALLGLLPSVDITTLEEGFKIYPERIKMPFNGIIIIDESSMINDKLYGLILKTARERQTRVLFVGDSAQLKPVNQLTISQAFSNTSGQVTLNTVIRTDNPSLLKESMEIRENGSFTRKTSFDEKTQSGVKYHGIESAFIAEAVEMFKSEDFKTNPLFARVVTYTNRDVEKYNKMIREKLFNNDGLDYHAGEILMGYSNSSESIKIGIDRYESVISNGTDYLITKAEYDPNKNRWKLTLKNLLSDDNSTIEIEVLPKSLENNQEAIGEIKKLLLDAKRKYENFYKDAEDKTKSPAERSEARKNGNKAYYEYKRLVGTIYTPFDITYKDKDQTKVLIPKTFDYGYAHTIHKSQGGTYQHVFVNGNVNLKSELNLFDTEEQQKLKEKARQQEEQQLKYVAVTRGAKSARIFLSGQKIIEQDPAKTSNEELELKLRELGIASLKQRATVAPYYNTEITEDNKEEIIDAIEQDFFTNAENIAKALGIKINRDKTSINLGGFTFESGINAGQLVRELSYTFELDTEDPNLADLFAALMAEFGYEQQEATIASNYVSNPNSSNAMQFDIGYSNLTEFQITNILKELGINDYTINVNTGTIQLLAFSMDESVLLEDTIFKLIDKLGNNYVKEKTGYNYIQSRYLDEEARGEIYKTWIEKSKQEGNDSSLFEKALRKLVGLPEPTSKTEFTNENSNNYSARTTTNADKSDVTIALATDFSTSGEQLTRKVAGNKYVNADIGKNSVKETADILEKQIKAKYNGKFPFKAIDLNIAGNGMYTFPNHVTQNEINDYVEEVLKELISRGLKIKSIRSGGQTGIDEAGIIAGKRLKIPTIVHSTSDFKFRNKQGQDISNEKEFKERFNVGEIDQSSVEDPNRIILANDNSNVEEINIAFNDRNGFEILSNFGNKPFTLSDIYDINKNLNIPLLNWIADQLNAIDVSKYETVEHLFQALKVLFADPSYIVNEYNLSDEGKKILKQVLNANTPINAKSLGSRPGIIKNLDTNLWNLYSPLIMKWLIYTSMKTNPNAIQTLLNTGEAKLIHNIKGEWEYKFPQILTELREVFKKEKSGEQSVFEDQLRNEFNQVLNKLKNSKEEKTDTDTNDNKVSAPVTFTQKFSFLSSESIDAVIKSNSIIEGLDTASVDEIIKNLSNKLVNAFAQNKVTNVEELRNELNTYLEEVFGSQLKEVNEFIDEINSLEKEIGLSPELVDEKNKLLKVKSILEILSNTDNESMQQIIESAINKFTEQLDIVETELAENQDIDEQQITSDEQIYSQSFYETSGKKTLSQEIKMVLSGIPTGETGIFGLDTFYSLDDVYNLIETILVNDINVTSNPESIINALKNVANTKPQLNKVIELLEASLDDENGDHKLINQFTTHFNRQFMNFRFIGYQTINGELVYKDMDANSNSLFRKVVTQWKNNFRSSPLIKYNDHGNPEANTNLAKELVDKQKRIWNNPKSSPDDKIEYIREFLDAFGIDVDSKTIEEIANAGFGYENGLKTKLNALFTNNASIFTQLMKKLNLYAKDNLNEEQQEQIQDDVDNIFNDSANSVKILVSIDSKFRDVYPDSSTRLGNKTVYLCANPNSTFLELRKVKSDKSYREEVLGQNLFSKHSILLKALSDPNDVGNINLSYLSLDALVNLDRKSKSSKSQKMGELSKLDQEKTKLGFFQNMRGFKSSMKKLGGLATRTYRQEFPTLSDKENIMYLNMIGIQLTGKSIFNADGKVNFLKDGSTWETTELFNYIYSQLIFPELERLFARISKDGIGSDISGYEFNSQFFNTLPMLNNLMRGDKEVKETWLEYFHFKLAGRNKNSESSKSNLSTEEIINSFRKRYEENGNKSAEDGFKYDVAKALAEFYDEKINEQISIWKELGIVEQDEDGNWTYPGFNSEYAKELSKSVRSPYGIIKLAAADLYINNDIGRANIAMVFNGDMALYGKKPKGVTSIFDSSQDPNRFENWSKLTYDNYVKRMAAELAPGQQLAMSEYLSDTYRQVVIKDPSTIASNIDTLVSIFYPDTTQEELDRIKNLYKEFQTTNDNKRALSIKNEIASKYPAVEDYLNIETTDGQEWTSAREHLGILYAQGKLTKKELTDMLDKLEKQSKYEKSGVIPKEYLLTNAELQKMFQPMKPVTTGNVSHNGINKKVYVKTSSFPLIPQLTVNNPGINLIRRTIEDLERVENGIPIRITFASGIKVGAPTDVADVFGRDGNLKNEYLENPKELVNIINNSSIQLPRDNFKIQMNVPVKDKGEISLVSQAFRVMFSDGITDINDFMFDGNKVSGKQLYDLYTDTYNEFLNMAKEELNKDLNLDKLTQGLTLDDQIEFYESIKSLLLKEAQRRGYPTQDIEALKIIASKKTNSCRFSQPLWSLGTSYKMESLLISVVSKAFIKTKMPGYSYVLGSSALVGKTIEDVSEILSRYNTDTNRIIFTSKWSGQLNGVTRQKDGSISRNQAFLPAKFNYKDEKGNNVQIELYKSDGSINEKYVTRKDGVLTLNTVSAKNYEYAKEMNAHDALGIKNKPENERTQDEIEQLMIYESMYEKSGKAFIVNELLDQLSFRIPFSSHLSASTLEIVGILPPEVGDLAILPESLMVQKGFDFDVDKEYAYTRTFKLDDAGNTVILDNEESNDPNIKKQALVNKMFDIYDSILSNPNPEVQSKINQALSMDSIKTSASYIAKAKSKTDHSKFNAYDHNLNAYTRQKGTVGKVGIGAYSNAITLLGLMQVHEEGHFKFQYQNAKGEFIIDSAKFVGQNVNHLNLRKALTNDRSIINIFMERQNAATDNVKVDALGQGGITKQTLPVDIIMNLLGLNLVNVTMNDGKIIPMELSMLLFNQPLVVKWLEKLANNPFGNTLDMLVELMGDLQEDKNIKLTEEDRQYLYDLQGVLQDAEKTPAEINQELMAAVENIDPTLMYKSIEEPNGRHTSLKQQFGMVAAYIYFDIKAKELSKLQNSLSIFSKGLGKSFVESAQLESDVNSILVGTDTNVAPNIVSEDPFTSISNAYELLYTYDNNGKRKNTFMGTILQNSLEAARTIGGELFLAYNPQIDDLITAINKESGLGEPTYTKGKVERKILILKEFNKYLFSNKNNGIYGYNLLDGKKNSEAISVLSHRIRLFKGFNGKPSLAQYLKTEMNRNDAIGKYLKKNPLLASFIFDIDPTDISIIKFDMASNSKLSESDLYSAIPKLIKDNIKLSDKDGMEYTTRHLAYDLVMYSYLEGGFQEAIQFVKYVPASYLREVGFGNLLSFIGNNPDAMQKVLENDYFLEQFFQHNKHLLYNIESNPDQFNATVKVEYKKGDGTGGKKVVKALHIDSNSISKNLITYKGVIYKYDKLSDNSESRIYVPIDSLGKHGMSEYQYGEANAKTIIRSQQSKVVKKPAIIPMTETNIMTDIFVKMLQIDFSKVTNSADILSSINNSLEDSIPTFSQSNDPVLQDTVRLVKILQHLLDNNKDSLKNVKVSFKSQEELNNMKTGYGSARAITRFVNKETNTIEIIINKTAYQRIARDLANSNYPDSRKRLLLLKMFAETVVHESVHAQTISEISKYTKQDDEYNVTATEDAPKAIKELVDAYTLAREKLGKPNSQPKNSTNPNGYVLNETYGLTKIEEFIAEVLSNEKFREKLRTIEVENKSLLDKIVDAILSIFGIKSGTLESQAFIASLNVIGKFDKGSIIEDLNTSILNDTKIEEVLDGKDIIPINNDSVGSRSIELSSSMIETIDEDNIFGDISSDYLQPAFRWDREIDITDLRC